METSIICSGFGGQGALFAGQILAYAAMESDKHVTWIPSYGPEMRGGTAHCTVVIADEPVASPLVRNPDCVIAINLPSADKYEPLVKSGGLMIVNSDLVTRVMERNDILTIMISGNALAQEAGDMALVNMVMLGALVALSNVVEFAAVEKALRGHLPSRHQGMLGADLRALHDGYDYGCGLRTHPIVIPVLKP
jgi:2-oxoglutarate ferredoxin oxidoreductase subunit gamma